VPRQLVLDFNGTDDPTHSAQPDPAAASALLHRLDVRLLTLTGPVSVGKTRHAIRVSEEVAADFADGVAFFPLAPLRDLALVLPAVAQVHPEHHRGCGCAKEGDSQGEDVGRARSRRC
jgi:predicted ATPase